MDDANGGDGCSRSPGRSKHEGRRGEVTLITGCMFSGKTTLMLDRLAACPAGSAVAVRHAVDDRYRTDAIVSHDGRSFPAHTIARSSELLEWDIPPGVRLIAIDEIHFLDDSLVEIVSQLARRGFDVMLAGLDLDSWGRPFPLIERLKQAATHVVPRTTTCACCGGVADHTQRLTPIVDGRMVGGSDHYEPRCAACWRPPPRCKPLPRGTFNVSIARTAMPAERAPASCRT